MHARPTPHVKRHPIRGALFGLGTGVGVALILIDRAVIAFGTIAPVFVVLAFIIIGILYGTVMPPKREPDPSEDPEPHSEALEEDIGDAAVDVTPVEEGPASSAAI